MQDIVDFVSGYLRSSVPELKEDKAMQIASLATAEVTSEVAAGVAAESAAETAAEMTSEVVLEAAK
jgi:hypothetical protein